MKPRVNWRTTLNLVGTVLKYISLAMCIPLVVSIVYGADTWVSLRLSP